MQVMAVGSWTVDICYRMGWAQGSRAVLKVGMGRGGKLLIPMHRVELVREGRQWQCGPGQWISVTGGAVHRVAEQS